VGDMLYSTYIGAGLVWGDAVSLGEAYAMDSRNGATLIGGHALAAAKKSSQHESSTRRVLFGSVIEARTYNSVCFSAQFATYLRGGRLLRLSDRFC